MSQIPARVIGVIDRAVGRKSDPPRARVRRWQRVLADFHFARIDAGQLVGTEFTKEWQVVLRDHNAVEDGVWRR